MHDLALASNSRRPTPARADLTRALGLCVCLLVAAWLAPGCGDDAPNDAAGCATQADCPDAHACLPDGQCVPTQDCASDSDCQATLPGTVCRAAQCVPPDAGVCATSADCAADEQCDAGACVAAPWECPPDLSSRTIWLDELTCPRAFSQLAAQPNTALFAGTASVKFVIDLQDANATYFINGRYYSLHYNFCSDHLNTPGLDPVGTHGEFNINQYRREERRFILGTLTFYSDANIIALEFATGDTINGEQIRFAFEHIRDRVYFADDLVYRPVSTDHERIARESLEGDLPILYTEELFEGVTYQPLNPGEAYGWLRLLGARSPASAKSTDLVVLDEAPNDIPPVAGVITQAFQTPLSHVNILSANRGTPNMGLRDALTDPRLTPLDGKLVHLVVEAQRFTIREATLEEAEPFWESLRPEATFVPPLDLETRGPIDLAEVDLSALPTIGAKAAGMAELMRVEPPVPTPEAPFAVPFAHYWEHMERHGLHAQVEALLADPRWEQDLDWRNSALALLRADIREAPVDRHLLAHVTATAQARFGDARVRFRSSTNSEDLPNFNGAGLYTSVSAQPGGGGRSVEDALRTVWASLWSDSAVSERAFYRIDHTNVAMAVLVHPSFPDEAANGVALTHNPFNARRPAFYVNAQAGEVSVTNPPPGVVPDQFLLYTWYEEPEAEYLSYSSMTDGQPVMTWDEVIALHDQLRALHDHFRDRYDPGRRQRNFGMDVEFKLLMPDRRLLIKQARPVPSTE